VVKAADYYWLSNFILNSSLSRNKHFASPVFSPSGLSTPVNGSMISILKLELNRRGKLKADTRSVFNEVKKIESDATKLDLAVASKHGSRYLRSVANHCAHNPEAVSEYWFWNPRAASEILF
jgi:hypothetical protein